MDCLIQVMNTKKTNHWQKTNKLDLSHLTESNGKAENVCRLKTFCTK